MSGSVFVDPISHTNTLAQTTVTAPLRLTLPFTFISLNDVGGTEQFTFIQHIRAINNAGLCCTRKGSVETCAAPAQGPATACEFDDFVEGEAEEDVVHQFQMFAGVGAPPPLGFQPEGGDAFAEAIIDPIFSIDPDAEFAPGQRDADFYTVAVSQNITLPEPAAALQVVVVLATLGVLRPLRRRGRRS